MTRLAMYFCGLEQVGFVLVVDVDQGVGGTRVCFCKPLGIMYNIHGLIYILVLPCSVLHN